MTSKKSVIALDHAKIGALLTYTIPRKLQKEQKRNLIFAVLDAAMGDADKFLYVPSVRGTELKDGIAKEFQEDFDAWIHKRTYQGKILKAEKVKENQKNKYDPDRKRHTPRGGKEAWDISVRQFMLEHRKEYNFRVVSADKDMLKNNFRNDNVLQRLRFERMSFKSFMASMLTHPGVELTRKQHNEIVSNLKSSDGKFGQYNTLERHQVAPPESYEAAQKIRDEKRRESPAGPKQKAKRGRAAKRGLRIMELGSSFIVAGIAASALADLIQKEAKEHGITFAKAAQQLGVDFSEEMLIGIAAEAGLDIAVSFTPIGAAKRAWEVLGNIDDIVSLMQFLGDVYTDIETIQQMAALADEVSNSAAFKAYVDGRDALTGAVSDAIKWVLGNSGSDEEAAQVIGQLRTALDETDGDMEAALARGASQAELEALLWQRAELSAPAPLVAPGFTAADLYGAQALPGDVPLFQAEVMAGSQAILPPGLSQGERLVPDAASEAGSDPGQQTRADGKGDRLARQTSYDRVRKLGRTPEEKAEALDDYEALVEENYLLTGDIRMAEEIAFEELQQSWQPSAFAADDGTVMKGPVETTYPDAEEDGHGYVRKAAEELLKGEGIRARKWFVEPNGQTAADRAQGVMDETGYGPRMTLLYEDETGRRHKLTEAFQADVGSARQRRRTAQEREDRKLAKAYGIAWPDTSGMTPFEAARARLQHAAELPELRERAKQAADDAKKTRQSARAALPKRKPVAGADRQAQANGAPVPPRRPEPVSGADLTSGG